MVTFSHHAVNFGAKALLIHQSHIWCEKVTILVPDRYNKKWFGAKKRYFLVQKRDISFFRTWCQNVNI